MVSIKYIGYFDVQNSDVSRKYVVSASNKMEYIAQAINHAGYDVEIVSTSASTESKFRWFSAEVKQQNSQLKVRYFATFGGSARILRALRIIWHTLNLFFFLVRNTRRNEPIIVYHSLGYYNAILWAKRIRHFRMILEVEEIYQDVKHYSKCVCKWEYAMFRAADAYIFSTELLDEKLNGQHKPSTVIYGNYRIEQQSAKKLDDGKIHVVYAGTLDPDKGGALAAIDAARYLPMNYAIHIIGFGTPGQIQDLRRCIAEIQSDARVKTEITYDGLLKGKDYIEFLQKCQIGLSTQNPDALFNSTSYPSKILSYLANGLQVVSADIKVVKRSAIGSEITYYAKQEPRFIAAAIQSVDLDVTHDRRQVVADLSDHFIKQIGAILS